MIETAEAVFRLNGKFDDIKIVPKLSTKISVKDDLQNQVRFLSLN